MSNGKRIKAARTKVDATKAIALVEAIKMLGKYSKEYKTKFDETIDVIFKLGVDAKQSDQYVRGAVAMPNGLGKSVRVAVICKADRVKEAKDAGADVAGAEEFLEDIKAGKLNFDVCIATPDMMPAVSKVGKVLGPKGLMPNPRLGTVSDNIKEAVKLAKAGQVEYKIDKAGIVHAAIGKLSFEEKAIKENFAALYDAVVAAKPSGAKGEYIKGIYLGSSMGPSIKLDLASLMG
jgi:large subunit ribosomal protein L1